MRRWLVAARQLGLAVLIAVSIVGCGSGETEDENPIFGTWVNEGREFAQKIVIREEGAQSFANVDDAEPWGETACVNKERWTDDAGDTWFLDDCTETVIATGETLTWCSLSRVSADGSVWEWNGFDSNCPEGHGPDDPAVIRYERADS